MEQRLKVKKACKQVRDQRNVEVNKGGAQKKNK